MSTEEDAKKEARMTTRWKVTYEYSGSGVISFVAKEEFVAVVEDR
jgi:hypothetical protein